LRSIPTSRLEKMIQRKIRELVILCLNDLRTTPELLEINSKSSGKLEPSREKKLSNKQKKRRKKKLKKLRNARESTSSKEIDSTPSLR